MSLSKYSKKFHKAMQQLEAEGIISRLETVNGDCYVYNFKFGSSTRGIFSNTVRAGYELPIDIKNHHTFGLWEYDKHNWKYSTGSKCFNNEDNDLPRTVNKRYINACVGYIKSVYNEAHRLYAEVQNAQLLAQIEKL